MNLPSKGVPEASDSCDKQDNQNFRYRVFSNDRVFTQVLILDIVVGRYSTEKSLSWCLMSIPFHACFWKWLTYSKSSSDEEGDKLKHVIFLIIVYLEKDNLAGTEWIHELCACDESVCS